MIMFTM